MAQWQFQDICHPSVVTALSAFKGSYEATPLGTTTVYAYSINAASVNDATGLITYTLKRNGTTVLSTQTHQLQPCSDLALNAVFDKMPVQDVLVAAALVVVFVLGIGQGWKS